MLRGQHGDGRMSCAEIITREAQSPGVKRDGEIRNAVPVPAETRMEGASRGNKG